jgi:hypothetical protein
MTARHYPGRKKTKNSLFLLDKFLIIRDARV